MSNFVSGTPVLLALAILFAAILYTRLALAWRSAHDDGRLRLVQMLSELGATDQALGSGYGAAVAMRRCVLCPHKKACDQWLASAARDDIGSFCPNAEFIADTMRSR